MFTLPIGLGVIALLLSRQLLSRLQGVLILCIALAVLWASLNNWLILALMDRFTILKVFNMDRLNFLLPMLWLLLLATLLVQVDWSKPLERRATALLLALTLAGIWFHDTELRNNVRLVAGAPLDVPTYRRFYAQDLFVKIKEAIPSSQANSKIATLGVFPNIALFNGFWTLDSYQNNYPLAYKNKFRGIIERELAKDASLRRYFNFWGSRCYVFSSEPGTNYLHSKHSARTVENLAIATDRLKRMHGDYLLSAVPVQNYKKLNMRLSTPSRVTVPIGAFSFTR